MVIGHSLVAGLRRRFVDAGHGIKLGRVGMGMRDEGCSCPVVPLRAA